MSAAAESILSDVPEFIGDAPESQPAQVGSETQAEDDPISALMAQVTFEPQDVQDLLEEFFDSLAERFESDHWKLTDRQARMLGKPAAQLANALWAKLMQFLPDVLSRWCESTPGATAFLFAVGIVVVPKVKTQISISRQRVRKAQQTVRDVQPRPQAVPRVGDVGPVMAQAVPPMQ